MTAVTIQIPQQRPAASAHPESIAHRPQIQRPGDLPRRWRAAIDLLPYPVFFIDVAQMRFVDFNRQACRSLGYSADELLRMAPEQLVAEGACRTLADDLEPLIAGHEQCRTVRTTCRRKDGLDVPTHWLVQALQTEGDRLLIVVGQGQSAQPGCNSGGISAAALCDASAARDPLTGLPDRRVLGQRLALALSRAAREASYRFAVLFVDLDGFKPVNDELGHLAGDRVLCEIAARIAGCVRPEDLVARHGGDEFVVLVDDLRQQGDAIQVAERIQAVVGLPVTFNGQQLRITASIGIATNRPDHRREEDLLAEADRAMYRAKALGKARLALAEQTIRPAEDSRQVPHSR